MQLRIREFNGTLTLSIEYGTLIDNILLERLQAYLDDEEMFFEHGKEIGESNREELFIRLISQKEVPMLHEEDELPLKEMSMAKPEKKRKPTIKPKTKPKTKPKPKTKAKR